MISSALLDLLRTVGETALVDQAAISRYTETSTADGITQTWTVIAAEVPCMVSAEGATGSERVGQGVVRAASPWTIWLPHDTDVTERDRLTVTGRDRTDGRTFEAQKVRAETYEALRAVECVLVS